MLKLLTNSYQAKKNHINYKCPRFFNTLEGRFSCSQEDFSISNELGHDIIKRGGAMTPSKGCDIVITSIIIKGRFNAYQEDTMPLWGCHALS